MSRQQYTMRTLRSFIFFFFNDTATTEIYTLSLHDALPIFLLEPLPVRDPLREILDDGAALHVSEDRKSTRLNSSHLVISYAVFCLKKKNNSTSKLTNAQIQI